MEANVVQEGDVTVVPVAQDTIEASNANAFDLTLKPLLTAGRKVVLDLSQVRFIDSMGCSMILAFIHDLTALGGKVKFCGVFRAVQAVFEMIRIHRVAETCTDREQAIAAFARPAS